MKKISKIIFILVLVLMLITTIALGIMNKKEYKLIDISGNKNELNDINVLFQEKAGFYNTKEIILSKDNNKVKNFQKEVYDYIIPTKENKENRKLIESWYNLAPKLYKDEESIGSVDISIDYDNYTSDKDTLNLFANVKDKKLSTNKVTTYEIPLETKLKYEDSVDFASRGIKCNKSLYLAVGVNINSYYNGINHASQECYISIYKLNLQEQTSDLITTYTVGKEKDLAFINNGLIFDNNDDIYFVKSIYSNDNKNTKFELVKYDLRENKFINTSLPIDVNDIQSLYHYCIEKNNVTFANDIYKDKSGELDIYLSTVNLLNNDVIEVNKKYTLKMNDKDYLYSLNDMKLLGNKLYLVVSGHKGTGDGARYEQVNNNFVYVIDKDNKSILYCGEIKGSESEYVSPKLISSNE